MDFYFFTRSLTPIGTEYCYKLRVCSHVSLMSTFFLPFQNGLNEFLWRCSHMTLKFFKKSLAKMVTLGERMNKTLWYTRLLHVQHVSSWTVLNVKCESGWMDQCGVIDNLISFIYIRAKVTSLPLGSQGIQFTVYIEATAAATKIKEKNHFRFHINEPLVRYTCT